MFSCLYRPDLVNHCVTIFCQRFLKEKQKEHSFGGISIDRSDE